MEKTKIPQSAYTVKELVYIVKMVLWGYKNKDITAIVSELLPGRTNDSIGYKIVDVKHALDYILYKEKGKYTPSKRIRQQVKNCMDEVIPKELKTFEKQIDYKKLSPTKTTERKRPIKQVDKIQDDLPKLDSGYKKYIIKSEAQDKTQSEEEKLSPDQYEFIIEGLKENIDLLTTRNKNQEEYIHKLQDELNSLHQKTSVNPKIHNIVQVDIQKRNYTLDEIASISQKHQVVIEHDRKRDTFTIKP